jgi:uncharacterized protein YjbJ (UPF0337 family)
MVPQFAELRASTWREHCLRQGTGRDLASLYLEDIMNKDQVKGVAEKAKGKLNEAAGKATGNVAREMKGDIQQGMGQARKDMGDAREAAKDQAKRHH